MCSQNSRAAVKAEEAHLGPASRTRQGEQKLLVAPAFQRDGGAARLDRLQLSLPLFSAGSFLFSPTSAGEQLQIPLLELLSGPGGGDVGPGQAGLVWTPQLMSCVALGK